MPSLPPASAPITVAGVRQRLVGLEGWLAAAAACAEQYNDDSIAETTLDAIAELGDEAQFQILPIQVVMAPDGTYDAGGPLPVEIHQSLPYFRDSASEFFHLTLPHHPIRTVQRLRLMLGNRVVAIVPPEWFSIDTDTGEFHLLPVGGSLAYVAGAWLGAAALGMSGNSTRTPAVCALDYTAGLPEGWQAAPRWRSLRRGLEERAARKVLDDIAHLYDAGLMASQIAAFGLSQTINYTRFNDRKQELDARVAEFLASFEAKHKPFVFDCL